MANEPLKTPPLLLTEPPTSEPETSAQTKNSLIGPFVPMPAMYTPKIWAWVLIVLMGFAPRVAMFVQGKAVPTNAWEMHGLETIVVCWSLAALLIHSIRIHAHRKKLCNIQTSEMFRTLLKAPLTEIRPVRVLLKADEKAYASVQANLQYTQAVGDSAIKSIATGAPGELVITNKRVIFAGDEPSFVLSIDDLLNTINYVNGVGFSDSQATYNFTIKNDTARILFSVVLNKVLRP